MKSSQRGHDGGSRPSTSSASVHRADYSKSFFHARFPIVVFFFVAILFVDGAAAQTSKGVVWQPVDESSSSSSPTTSNSSGDSDLTSSASPTVTTLQAMAASQSKTLRRKPQTPQQTSESSVLPPVTIVDNKNAVGVPPTVTYVDSNNVVIPAHTTFDAPPNVISTTKDEIHVDTKEDKIESRPEEEKEVLIYDDIYPRRVKQSQLRSSHHFRQQQREAWRLQQQQRRRQDSERRRRYFVSRPWRQQQHHSRPPYGPPVTSGSTRYFIPPASRPPHPNEDPVAEGSVKTASFPEHAKVVAPPPATRYRQLVPGDHETPLDEDNDFDDDDFDEEDSNRRHDLNRWLGGQPKTRRHQERGRSHTPNGAAGSGNNVGFFRSMMGVSPFCLHDDIQFNCVLTPVCWMAGGETLSGCDSMLYSCCVEASIARKVRPSPNEPIALITSPYSLYLSLWAALKLTGFQTQNWNFKSVHPLG